MFECSVFTYLCSVMTKPYSYLFEKHAVFWKLFLYNFERKLHLVHCVVQIPFSIKFILEIQCVVTIIVIQFPVLARK